MYNAPGITSRALDIARAPGIKGSRRPAFPRRCLNYDLEGASVGDNNISLMTFRRLSARHRGSYE